MRDQLTRDVANSYTNNELDQHVAELDKGQLAVPPSFKESYIPFALVCQESSSAQKDLPM